MKNWVNEKVIPKILKFVNLKAIIALRNGMIYAMPFTIIGSVFLLLANLPVESWANWVYSSGLSHYFSQAYGATFAIVSIFTVMGISYSYVKNEGYEAMAASMIALVCFIITLSSSAYIQETGTTINNIIDKNWTGGTGIISAIIIGLIVGYVYTYFMKNNIRIKLPESVPENVSNSFSALIPGAVLITFFLIVYAFFSILFNLTMVEWIYEVIQRPLQGITDSFAGALVIAFLIPFLWFFGVHGSALVSGIMGPLLQANALANQAIIDAGYELTVANGGHIVTQQFVDQYLTVTGGGMTIGIAIFMVLFARSAQFKELGKLSFGPGFFNINEPIIFATPIIMNPIMLIPFILAPVVSAIITYFALYTGLVPLFTAVSVPWTTPPIISGFLVAGVRGAILQIVVLVISFFIYLPFIRRIDQINLKVENPTDEKK